MSRKTMLAVKTHALGDLLLVTPALHHLRTGVPDARLVLLTTSQCVPLLKGNDDIDDVLVMRHLSTMSAVRVLPALRRASPSRAVVFQASPLACALARLAGARTVHALQRQGESPWPPPFARYTADAYLDLASRAVRIPASADHDPRLFVDPEERSAARRLIGPMPFAVVAPAGGKNPRQSVPAKRWSADGWAALCDMIQSGLGLRVVLVGSADDGPMTSPVVGMAHAPVLDLTGRTDLRTLISVIAEASVVVTIDSVALHMAVALNRPLVALFGPTSCRNFLPPGRDHQRGVCSPVPCSPCYGNSLFPGCRLGTPVCMKAHTVDEVWETVRSVMG